ncbi:MAG: endonuclease/exonuclease/phosphatase family protein [Actinobacteria bacterium]|nr:endonuclease/exonuclease/phosphatase family protein [Actinomycetota bacterium]
MPLLIRTWNVFHGNAHPPRRRGYLRVMLELASADRPNVLCLQELPAWSLPKIDDWAGMHSVWAVTRPPFWPGALAAWTTRLHQGLFRSALAGQANAILVDRSHEVEDLGHERISDHGRERRLVQAVRIDGQIVVANLHASNDARRPEVPGAEIGRARAFAESVARPGEAVVIAGDFNVRHPELDGYSAGGDGIDHVLVCHAAAQDPLIWPVERRRHNGIVLSDHAPVELTLTGYRS